MPRPARLVLPLNKAYDSSTSNLRPGELPAVRRTRPPTPSLPLQRSRSVPLLQTHEVDGNDGDAHCPFKPSNLTAAAKLPHAQPSEDCSLKPGSPLLRHKRGRKAGSTAAIRRKMPLLRVCADACSDDPDHEFGEACFSTPSTSLSSCSMHTETTRSPSSSCSLRSGDRFHPDAEEQLLPFSKHVSFSAAVANSEHAITPYSEVYGRHPRFFDFDRKGGMQLTDEGVAEELLEEEEEHVLTPPPRLPPLGPEVRAAGGIRPGPKLVVDGDGQQWLAWKQESEAMSQ
mmetsp:Transcript_138902/g.276970  ORF Transcript_138902/g.276970 Transcript_138902/m.276970 type:complete len:286 (-) Transcript_138902:261-1118(-)